MHETPHTHLDLLFTLHPHWKVDNYNNFLIIYDITLLIYKIVCFSTKDQSVVATRSPDHLHIYIYIYIYANFIKHNRHFMPTYFLLDPFEFPYYFYRIRGELI